MFYVKTALTIIMRWRTPMTGLTSIGLTDSVVGTCQIDKNTHGMHAVDNLASIDPCLEKISPPTYSITELVNGIATACSV